MDVVADHSSQVDLHLVPILTLLYLACHIDRANIGKVRVLISTDVVLLTESTLCRQCKDRRLGGRVGNERNRLQSCRRRLLHPLLSVWCVSTRETIV